MDETQGIEREDCKHQHQANFDWCFWKTRGKKVSCSYSFRSAVSSFYRATRRIVVIYTKFLIMFVQNWLLFFNVSMVTVSTDQSNSSTMRGGGWEHECETWQAPPFIIHLRWLARRYGSHPDTLSEKDVKELSNTAVQKVVKNACQKVPKNRCKKVVKNGCQKVVKSVDGSNSWLI